MHYIIKKRTMVKIILITALCSSLISIIATLLIIIYLRKRNKQKHGNNETNYNYIPNKTIIRQHNNKSSHTETAQIQRPKNTKKDLVAIVNQQQQKKLLSKECKIIEREKDVPQNHENTQKRYEQQVERGERRKFNPKITKPSNVTFTTLAVSEGRLVPNTVGQTAYYRSWEYEGRFFFEFFCDKSKTEKAINNHYVIIDPFCQRSAKSTSIDTAKRMTNMVYGEIDSNYTVISKSIILFE